MKFDYGVTPEAFILLSLGILIILLRLALKAGSSGLRGLEFDDYLMLPVMVVYSLETMAAYAQGAFWAGLSNNGLSDFQRRILDPKSSEYYFRVQGAKTQLVGWAVYVLMLWLCKLSVCFFYSRLTAGLYYYEFRLRICYIIIFATFVATEMSILLSCRPLHRNWQIHPNPGNYCQPAISKVNLYVTVTLNASTDILLTSIPLSMLWGTAIIPLRKKLSLSLIFSGAVFVIAAGILRCALILSDPSSGAPRATSWACRETFVAVVITNAPVLFPYLYRASQYLKTSTIFRVLKSPEKPGHQMHTVRSRREQPWTGRSAGASRLPSTSDEEMSVATSIPVTERYGSWFIE